MSDNPIIYSLSPQGSQIVGNLSDLTTTDKSNIVAAINENVTNISGNTTNIGDLTNLTTTNKSNLVAAINENVVNISGNTTNIGDLTNLTTTNKSNLVAAINENVTNISGNTTNIGNLTNLTTTNKSNLVAAINENASNIAGTVLYENSSGTTGTVTLSDSAANYKRIIIHYKDYNGYCKTVTVDDPDGKSISMEVLWHRLATTQLYLKVEQALITGNSIEIAGNKGLTRVGNNASICENGGEQIYIWKVIGYNY